jgi:hypothetical protein
VIVHYSRGEKEATAVVTDIRNAGGKAEKVAADLRTADGPHLLAERARDGSQALVRSSIETTERHGVACIGRAGDAA